jgi:hypothetical protein
MTNHNIIVDKEQGRISINELSRQIDIKSAISPTQDNPYNQQKQITPNDLNHIFVTSKHDALRTKILEKLETLETLETQNKITLVESEKIKLEFLKILSTHKAVKQKASNKVDGFMLNKDEVLLVQELYDKLQGMSDKTILYAVIIDIIADKIREDMKCS